MKLEYWIIKFYGIADKEFESLANRTTLPIQYNRDKKFMVYEWYQYAKTELGICANVLMNSHGKCKWRNRCTEVNFEDGSYIILTKTNTTRGNL